MPRFWWEKNGLAFCSEQVTKRIVFVYIYNGTQNASSNFFSENQILCAKSVKIHKVTWYLVLHLNEFDMWIWDYSSLQMKKNIVRGWKEKNSSCNNYIIKLFVKFCAFWVLWRKSNSAWMLIFFLFTLYVLLNYYSQKNNASNHGKLNIIPRSSLYQVPICQIFSNAIFKNKSMVIHFWKFGSVLAHIRVSSMSKNMGRRT